MELAQPRQVGLAGENDRLGCKKFASLSDQPRPGSATEPRYLGLLVYHAAMRLDCARQATDQTARMETGAIGSVEGAVNIGHTHSRGDFFRAQILVSIGQAELLISRQRGL